MIGTDVQNTTLPDKKPAKAIPAGQKRDMIKQMLMQKAKKELNPYGR
jgi:hypothetical protein